MTEFVWFIPNDDNRIDDGRALRREFLYENGTHEHIGKEDFGPCSVLEVLIGISRRLAWLAGGAAEIWAWQLLDNLDLLRMSDPLSNRNLRKVDEILETLIWRTYSPDGTGGFFPLLHPEQDQTKVEIWYQMAAYINEAHPEYPHR